MYCPSCGKGIGDGSAFCMYCGKPTVVGGHADVAPASTTSTSPLACPICHQIDAVRHVRGVIAKGVSISRSTTQTSGSGSSLELWAATGGTKGIAVGASAYSGQSYSQGISMTALAAKLLELSSGFEQYNRALMSPSPSRLYEKRYVTLRKFGSPIEPWVYYDLELSFRNSLLHKHFYDTCENLYYCERDAGVFVPGEGDFTVLDDLKEYLYRYPNVAEREFCQVGCVSYLAEEGRFIRIPELETLWAAMAYNGQGVYIANQFRAKHEHWLGNGHDKNGRDFLAYARVLWTPLSHCTDCSSGYHQIIANIEATGWTKLSEQGTRWWQARFVRPRA